MTRPTTRLISSALFAALTYCGACLGADLVLREVPDGGVQPRLVTDRQGEIHLLYFKAQDDSVGHLFYRRYLIDADDWSDAIQVSTTPFPRPEIIARASMAVDDNGRVHVSWYVPPPRAAFPTPAWFRAIPAYLYARSIGERRQAFETERSLLSRHITGAETGAELALLGESVSLVWHGAYSALRAVVESNRSVNRRVSHDLGETFAMKN